MTQPNQQRSPGTERLHSGWQLPLSIFAAVALSVSLAGSLLLFAVSLVSPDAPPVAVSETPEAKPRSGRAVAQHRPPMTDLSDASAVGFASKEDSPLPIASISQAGAGVQSPETPSPPTQRMSDDHSVAADHPAIVDTATTRRETVHVGEPRRAKPPPTSLNSFATIELPGEAVDYAFDPQQDKLAIIGPWKDSVGFVSAEDRRDGQLRDLKILRLDGTPKAIEYKPRSRGAVFAVLHSDPHRLVFIDSDTLKPLKTLTLESAPRCIAAASDAASPHLYVGTAAATLRVDAERMEIDVIWPEVRFADFATSPDGQRLYHRLAGRSRAEVTVALPRPPDSDPLISRKAIKAGWKKSSDTGWESFTRNVAASLYHPDPQGLLVATGSDVYSADLSTRMLELDYDVKAFLTDRPFMAGVRQDAFVIGSLNDGRAIATVPLPDGWSGSLEERQRQNLQKIGSSTLYNAASAHVFADQAQTEFVLAMQQQVVTLRLSAFDLPAESLLRLSETPSPTAIAGIQYTCALKAVPDAAEASLAGGPDGMQVKDGVLRWTPTDKQLGETDVRVRLSENGISREVSWKLSVRQQTLEIPFIALGCAVSTDGRRVAVWGNDWPTALGRDRLYARVARYPGPRLAIVDMATREIVAETEFAEPIGNVEFNRAGIFVATFSPQSSKEPARVIRVAPDTLQPQGELEVAAAPFFTTIADRILIASQPRDWSKRYRLPDLEPLEPPQPTAFRAADADMPLAQLADGWLLDGVLWDDQMKRPQLLVAPVGFHGGNIPGPHLGQDPHLALRGYVINGPNRPVPRSTSLPHQRTFTPYFPALLSVTETNGIMKLNFMDIMSEEVVRSVTLRVPPWDPSFPYDGVNPEIKTTPDHVLVVDKGEVFVVPGNDASKPISLPFRIEPRQSAMTVSATESTKVIYTAKGALEFELELRLLNAAEPPMMTSADGQFEIDLADALAEHVDQLARAIQNSQQYGLDRAQRVNVYVQKMSEDFHRLTGKIPSGVPVIIQARVQATDNDGSVAQLDHAYLVDIPMTSFHRYTAEGR